MNKTDLKYAQLIIWGNKGLTERERELIYIFLNFDRAYMTKEEIRLGLKPNEFDLKKMTAIENMLKRQKVPFDLNEITDQEMEEIEQQYKQLVIKQSIAATLKEK